MLNNSYPILYKQHSNTSGVLCSLYLFQTFKIFFAVGRSMVLEVFSYFSCSLPLGLHQLSLSLRNFYWQNLRDLLCLHLYKIFPRSVLLFMLLIFVKKRRTGITINDNINFIISVILFDRAYVRMQIF